MTGCGIDDYVEKIKPFIDAGYTEVALAQIGEDQQDGFIEWAERELLSALRSIRPFTLKGRDFVRPEHK